MALARKAKSKSRCAKKVRTPRFQRQANAAAYKKDLREANKSFSLAHTQALIAAKTNDEIRDMMATIIVDKVTAGGAVAKSDFERAHIKPDRIEANFKAALALAKERNPEISSLMVSP